MKQDIIICSCNSFEHQAIFFHSEVYDENLYVYFHLTTHKNIFKRVWYGLKYVFGYKSRFGAWDEFLFSDETEKELYLHLKDKYDSIEFLNK